MTSSEKDAHRADMAERLRLAREYVGLTQEEVAKVLGISCPAFAMTESGVRNVESTELRILARVYRRSMEYLLTGKEPTPKGPEQLAFFARTISGRSDRDLNEVAQFAEFLKRSATATRKE